MRTGDTPARERALQVKRPPHILITTPESLYILLTAEQQPRRCCATPSTVIVDEIHAVAADKRGAHLALSLERLDALAGGRLQRIGLSATQKPIDEVARLLVGAGRCDARRHAALRDRRRRPPPRPRSARRDARPRARRDRQPRAARRDLRPHRRARRARTARRSSSSTRAAWSSASRTRSASASATSASRAHHGSMSRETAPGGRDRAQVGRACRWSSPPPRSSSASTSAHVDLVCHLGAPRSLASLLQRVGRSGHSLGAVPKGVLFPLTRDELVQCAAAVRAVEAGELDRARRSRTNPLDILAQQIVAIGRERGRDRRRGAVGAGAPRLSVPRPAARDFDARARDARRGRRRRGAAGARRTCTSTACTARLRPRRGARLAAITGGGAIPDTADYDVIEDATNARRRQGQRGLRHREHGGRHLPARQPLLAHPPRRGRPRARRRRRRRAADDAVLARRSAGAHGRAVGSGRRSAPRGRRARRRSGRRRRAG